MALPLDVGPPGPPARCRLCGRPLRNPASAARGVGPVCFGRAARTISTEGRRALRVLELELPLEPVYRRPLFG